VAPGKIGMSNLPVGWGQRTNAEVPGEDGKVTEKVGDWSALSMPSRYAKGAKEPIGNVPFGFGDRSNAKTVEELSLDRSATNVAIAEVLMKDQPQSILRSAQLLDAKKAADRDRAKETAAMVSPAPPQAQGNSSNSDALLNMLAAAIIKMDQRLERMERSIQLVLQQQQQIMLGQQHSDLSGSK